MNNYELMKLSETADDDAFELDEIEQKDDCGSDAERFKRKYKEFYTDIKLSHKEDW